MPEDAGGRYRAMIDRGRTGNKIPASDPGAAPLGADAEASGTPTAGGFTARDDAARHYAAQAEKQAKTLPGTLPHPNSGIAQRGSALPWLLGWSLLLLGALAIVIAALET